MVKSSWKIVLINLALVCGLLALEWYETHGGPIVVPTKSFIFLMLLVPPLTTVFYALLRCRPRGDRQAPAN